MVKQKEKGFRDGIKKEDLVTSLSKEEKTRILEQREFDSLDFNNKGSMSWKVALECDSVRGLKVAHELNIDNCLADIVNSKGRAEKLKVQLAKGEILEELKPGMPMTVLEVDLEIRTAGILIKRGVRAVLSELAQLRMIVGTRDVLKNIILTEDEYDGYTKMVEKALEGLGLQLFTVDA